MKDGLQESLMSKLNIDRKYRFWALVAISLLVELPP